MPEGHDADHFRKVVLDNFDMSLGTGLNKIKGKAFRIAHLGHFNELMLMGTLSGVEMGLDLAKVPHRSGGVLAAMESLKDASGADAEIEDGGCLEHDAIPEQKERAMNAPVNATEDLLYVVEDGIARLTFNRPQARNALTFAMYEQMAAICESINADRSIKAMILTGRRRQGVCLGNRHLAVPRLQDRAGRARLRGADRSRAGRAGAGQGADDCGHCRRLHRRRGGDRRLLRHADRHGVDPDRLSDRAHAGQLPVDVQHLQAHLTDRAGADQGSDLYGPADRGAGSAGAGAAQRSRARRRNACSAAPMKPQSWLRATRLLPSKSPRRRCAGIRRTLSRDEGEDLILRAYMSEDFREGMDAFLNKRTPSWKGNRLTEVHAATDCNLMRKFKAAGFKRLLELSSSRSGR
jgi:enoyl-CoA hydratase/carnithine racemase